MFGLLGHPTSIQTYIPRGDEMRGRHDTRGCCFGGLLFISAINKVDILFGSVLANSLPWQPIDLLVKELDAGQKVRDYRAGVFARLV